MTTYKIIEDQAGRTASKGENGAGLTEDAAHADAERRNAAAVELGIKTRYSVAVLAGGEEDLAEAA